MFHPQTAPCEAPGQDPLGRWPALVERWPGSDGRAGVVIICEHGSNRTAAPWGDLGLDAEGWAAHVAWDIGALGLARGLAERMAPACGGAVLVHAPLSRLIYDLNRAPGHAGAMPERSEIHDVPGNRALTPQARQHRLDAVYLPFHATLHAEIARLLVQGIRPALIAVHSFTPVWFGNRRSVEFGVIHDDDPALSMSVMAASRGCGLQTRLNEPYSAEGDVTHTIRLHAGPCRLANTMLEIRNDLIADAGAQVGMAGRLAPVLIDAMAATEATACLVPG